MAKWDSRLKLLLLIHLLMSDVAFGKDPLPQSNSNPSITSNSSQREQVESPEIEDALSAAHELVLNLSASLQGQLDLQSNISCAELADGGRRGSGFSQELLGLTVVPVLVSAGCLFEARDLVMQLYADLGQNNTHDFLEDIVMLIKRGRERESANGFQTPIKHKSESQHHLQAVWFNILQLSAVDDRAAVDNGRVWQCKRWLEVKAYSLQGQTTEQSKPLRLEEAKQACRRMGTQCAGVNHDSGSYRVILKPGSYIVPSSNSDSWIQDCKFGSARWRRVPQHHCVNEQEEQLHMVMEWIPVLSMLYNMGSAIYYASLYCYDTAQDRVIYGAVDVGTDTLAAMTGGYGYLGAHALGAGIKQMLKST